MTQILVDDQRMLETLKGCAHSLEKLQRAIMAIAPTNIEDLVQLRQLRQDCHDAIYTLKRRDALRSLTWGERSPGEVAFEAFCSRAGGFHWDKMTDAMKED